MSHAACGGIASAIRRTLVVFIGAFVLSLFGQEKVTEVFSRENWYQARSEREQTWRGVLREREPLQGPNSRNTLLFTLVAGNQSIAVYAAGVAKTLKPFAGKQVSVRGKLVDLRDEGYGEELWIGSIGAGNERK